MVHHLQGITLIVAASVSLLFLPQKKVHYKSLSFYKHRNQKFSF